MSVLSPDSLRLSLYTEKKKKQTKWPGEEWKLKLKGRCAKYLKRLWGGSSVLKYCSVALDWGREVTVVYPKQPCYCAAEERRAYHRLGQARDVCV